MEARTVYVYTIGQVSELFSKPTAPTTNRSKLVLELITQGQSILAPTFLGVYQVMATKDEKDVAELVEEAISTVSSATRFLKSRNVDDTVPPQLIGLGYVEGWTPETVRMSFKDPLRRVAVYPVTDLPDFSKKAGGKTIQDILREIKRRGVKDKLETHAIFSKEIADLRRERVTYGFTREEQAFLESISPISTN